MKKVLVFVLLSLLLFSFVGFTLVQAAKTGERCTKNSDCTTLGDVCSNGACVPDITSTSDKSSGFCKFLGWSKLGADGLESNWFCKRLAMWEPGVNAYTDKGMVALFFKYIMLFLLIVLIYSGLSYAQFPESRPLQFIIAIVLGFLITFMISTEELMAAMTSYSALGITLIVFFPIMILGFFTILVASKANPVGIFVQRIMWIIYAVFLFIKAGTMALGKWWISIGQPGNIGNEDKPFGQLVQFVIGNDLTQYSNISSAVLLVLVIVAIAVFYLMVWKDHAIVAWLAKEKREAEIEGERGTIERSNAYDKLRAEKMEKQK